MKKIVRNLSKILLLGGFGIIFASKMLFSAHLFHVCYFYVVNFHNFLNRRGQADAAKGDNSECQLSHY